METFSFGLSLDLVNAMKELSTRPKYAGFDTLTQMTRAFRHDSIVESVLKAIETRNKIYNNSNDLATTLSNQAKAMQIAVKGISNSFQDLAKNQKLISEKLLLTANSQIALISSMNALTKSINPNIYKNLSALTVTMETFSNFYIDLSIKSKEWENLDIFQETTERIRNVADDLTAQNRPITIKDLNSFKTEIINELTSSISRLKNNKTINLILKIIPLISLAIAIQTRSISRKDISNKNVLESTKKEILKLDNNIKNKVLKIFEEIQIPYIAINDVHLREFPDIKSQSLGIIKKGQEIIVLNFRTKWLFITYRDSATRETKSGYVYKIYFQPVNQ